MAPKRSEKPAGTANSSTVSFFSIPYSSLFSRSTASFFSVPYSSFTTKMAARKGTAAVGPKGDSKEKRPMSKVGSGSGSGSGAAEVEHVEDAKLTVMKTPRKARLRKHCGRFWLCYLIAAIIFSAIFLPLVFLKIIPALAQLIVNKTSLPIYGGSIQAISNDQLIIGLETALTVPAGLTVSLDPLDLFLYNKDSPEFSPYLTVPLGRQELKGHTVINIQNQTISVGNRTELNAWLTSALNDVTTSVSVRGNTTAHLGALKAHIHLEKTVEIAALDKLTGVSIADARFVLPAEADGTNIAGHFTLPNYSALTLGLGNVTFNVWSGDILVGQAALLDVDVAPGNSTLPFRGELFLDTITSDLVGILTSQGEYLSRGILGLGINGNTTVVDGEHVEYLEDVLNAASLWTEVPVTQLLVDGLSSVLGGNISLLSGLGDIFGGGDGGSDDETKAQAVTDLLDRYLAQAAEVASPPTNSGATWLDLIDSLVT
ncbi:hypothetical protein GGR56DRAFT_544 [Xylariaceae sp. FL0804]|nr:hypothetical protein GGR56DRAFT_544 [Xylariaceae sp. FL0804]